VPQRPTGPLMPIRQTDFSGGVNAVTNPYVVGEKQLQRVRNMLLDEHGSLRTRDGFSVISTSPAAGPILLRGLLNQVNGTHSAYALQQQMNGTALVLYDTTTSPWTVINTFNSTEFLPQSVTMNNTDIIALGYQTPVSYNGTTTTAITAGAGQSTPPGAKHIAFHLASLWVWNTNPATTSSDGPSSLRASDVNNFNSWPNASQAFVGKDDGQVGMGMATYTIAETGISPTQTLVLFKNISSYQVLGTFGATNFSVQKIKTDMGCIAPRTIQFVSGFGIIRLTHKGFALFNGVDDRLISEEVRPYIYGRDDITAINFSSVDRSWAVQSQNPPLYIAACPVNGTSLQRYFVYDLVRRAWTICDFPVDTSCLFLYTTANTQPLVQAGTAVTNQLLQLFSGAANDNGTAINWSFRTRNYNAGSPTGRAFFRRLILDFFFIPIETVTVSSNVLGIGTPITKTDSFDGAPPSALWGTGTWGSMVWGATGAADGRQDVDILRTAPSIYYDISGIGPVRLRALETQIRVKPFTRAVS